MQFVRVFGKPKCQQCRMVKRWLDEHNINYEYSDITEDTHALGEIKLAGFLSVPVTYIDSDDYNGYVQGFNPSVLQSILGGK